MSMDTFFFFSYLNIFELPCCVSGVQQSNSALHIHVFDLPTWLSFLKNHPAMKEIWVQSLGWEDMLRRTRQASPAFLPGELMDRVA